MVNRTNESIRISLFDFYLDLHDIDSLTFLTPFLDIIRSDETSGPVTCLALNAVNKFLSYGLIGKINSSFIDN